MLGQLVTRGAPAAVLAAMQVHTLIQPWNKLWSLPETCSSCSWDPSGAERCLAAEKTGSITEAASKGVQYFYRGAGWCHPRPPYDHEYQNVCRGTS